MGDICNFFWYLLNDLQIDALLLLKATEQPSQIPLRTLNKTLVLTLRLPVFQKKKKPKKTPKNKQEQNHY